MRDKEKQPRLFEAEKVVRNRKPFKRVSRSKNDITPFVRFLKTYRMIADSNNGKVKIKELQDKFRIGHFARAAMPSDILTIPESLINEEYAETWRKTQLSSYYNECDRKSREYDDTPLAPVVEVPHQEPTPSLSELLAEIERATKAFISDMEREIKKAKALLINI
jgi:hypothetical protein